MSTKKWDKDFLDEMINDLTVKTQHLKRLVNNISLGPMEKKIHQKKLNKLKRILEELKLEKKNDA